MSNKFWDSVINDYENLLENGERYDVIIYAGENEKEFRVHSAILCITLGHNTFVQLFQKGGPRKKMVCLF